jgi:hypothetical protein
MLQRRRSMATLLQHHPLPNTRIPDLLRQVLRRLDEWTLIAFNPRYPGPARR